MSLTMAGVITAVPVTTKANHAYNAKGESAIFIGVFAKAVKNLIKQKGG